MEMSLPTVIFIVLAAIWMGALQWAVIARRRAKQIAYSHGDDKVLAARIRIHANAFESLLPFILLLLVADQIGLWTWVSLPLMALMLIGRVLHPWGMLNPRSLIVLRMMGMLCSLIAYWAIILALVVKIVMIAVAG